MSLSKQEYYKQGRDNDQRCGIHQSTLLRHIRNTLCNIYNGVGKYGHIRHQHGVIGGVRPLPGEGKEENRYHHIESVGKHYLEEGSEASRTVNVCGHLKLLRHSAEELSHKVYVKTVLQAQSRKGHYGQGPEGVEHTHGIETYIQRKLYNLRRDQQRQQNNEEQQVGALELEPGKAIAHEGRNKQLCDSHYQRQQECIQQ